MESLAVFNGQLVVGGTFDRVADLPGSVGSIAAWDGQEWHPLPTLSGRLAFPDVFDMVVYNGELIIGGELDRAGTVDVTNVAAWNGTSWRPLGALGNSANKVRAFTLYQESLYAGGEFDDGFRHITRWNGSAWQPVAGGIDDSDTWVADLVVYNNRLVAGGQFFNSNPPYQDLVTWDGFSWTGFPQSIYGTAARVESLGVYNGDLIVSGRFDGAGTVPSASIARWTGTQWRGFDGGLTGCTGSSCFRTVYEFAVYNGELIAVGNFVSVGGAGGGGGIASPHFARWTDTGIPHITRHPLPQVADADDTVMLPVTVASGYNFSGPVTYQWQRNGINVVDGPGGASPGGGTVAGATSEKLTISGIRFSDSGQFTVRVANSCGTVTSLSAFTRVRCAGDFNADGSLDSQDFFEFLTAFFALQLAADINQNGFIDSQDFFNFLTEFFAGC